MYSNHDININVVVYMGMKRWDHISGLFLFFSFKRVEFMADQLQYCHYVGGEI